MPPKMRSPPTTRPGTYHSALYGIAAHRTIVSRIAPANIAQHTTRARRIPSLWASPRTPAAESLWMSGIVSARCTPTTVRAITGTVHHSFGGIAPSGEAPAHAHSGSVGNEIANGSHENAVYFNPASYSRPPASPIAVNTVTVPPSGTANKIATRPSTAPVTHAVRGLITPIATGLSARPASTRLSK